MERLYSLLIICCMTIANIHAFVLTSPSGSITMSPSGKTTFAVEKDGRKVMDVSVAGLKVGDKTYAPNISKVLSQDHICDYYTMVSGKKKVCHNEGNEYAFAMGKDGKMLVRVYDDGIAVRYVIANCKDAAIGSEETSYRLLPTSTAWLQKYNEPYEDFFPKTSADSARQGQWGYPALVEAANGLFALISEANIGRTNSASRLSNERQQLCYDVVPADNPATVSGEWATPWRVATIGDLSAVVESTLISDLSEPSVIEDTAWIEPGVASWIYWAYNHGSNDYQIVKKYIDMAETLRLPYVLIDAEWDEMGNGGNIDDAVRYALNKGVKPIIWYNSSTGWLKEWGAPGPHERLNDPDRREAEFAKIAAMGVAGVKIDFFSGDTQPTMDYCIDLLESAAKHHLLVNFHGATIPRGWQRTYPNLMSVEAVYGAEWYNNAPTLTDRAAAHNATLPFTRNVVGSMDYTPCTFSDSQHPHITSNGHELALTVLFESALQHLADKPESYLAQPKEVQNFFGQLPSTWDETRLLGGFPGEWAAIGRRAGDTWYVGVINGSDEARTIEIDWSAIFDKSTPHQFTSYSDHTQHSGQWHIVATYDSLPEEIALLPRGGQVLVIK